MAIDVFVSYHTDTSLDIAKAVVQKLESQGLRCWYQDRDARGAFGGVIKRTIEECGAFVVILNGQAARSRHVLNEVALAFDREELEILPIRMTRDSLGDDMEYYLHRIHQINGHGRSLEAALEDLCRRTLRALGRSEIPAETIQYDDGCVYVGQVVNGKRHGIGKLTWPDGDVYEGAWKDDKRTGKGKFTWPDGNVYEGDFVAGKITGKGKKVWANGDIYEGGWKDDKCTGKGKYTWANGDIYEGDWKDDKRTGKGKYTWPDGNVYEGDFVAGKITGKGKRVWASGNIYEGDFLEGKRTGIGTFTYANGRIESGRWKDGKFLG
ncbi:MAG: TIR domain-containing protein [Oscillospiraceae bacterium]|nr:TIR domain-containing protein [Oscillospiraceae bacterium]